MHPSVSSKSWPNSGLPRELQVIDPRVWKNNHWRQSRRPIFSKTRREYSSFTTTREFNKLAVGMTDEWISRGQIGHPKGQLRLHGGIEAHGARAPEPRETGSMFLL